jgi:AcrR family transcriptional regulator
MSPQRSNRARIIEGTLRCLERLAPEQVTARVIARESDANLASITYHFGSKENLITEAVIEGLDRWLAEIAGAMGEVESVPPAKRFARSGEILDASAKRHAGLAKNFIAALARAQYDERVRELLASGFGRARSRIAELLGLGDDQAASNAAGVVLAILNGLLFQALLDPDLAIEGEQRDEALARLREVLPEPAMAVPDVSIRPPREPA